MSNDPSSSHTEKHRQSSPGPSLTELQDGIACVSLDCTEGNCAEEARGVAVPAETFLCTICLDSTEVSLRAYLPDCQHSFCLSCVLSWAKVQALCPNCKAPFESLLVHRNVAGEIVAGPCTADGTLPWVQEHISILMEASWVETREVLPPLQDVENSFTLPPLARDSVVSASSPAPLYSHEEIEDEYESLFWEEEDEQYQQLMGSTRVLSNRRFGANGYISAGRLRATPHTSNNSKKPAGSSGAGALGSSAGRVRAQEVARRRAADPASNQARGAGSSSGGARKKKLKKKSREGIAAAARKKAEAEAAARAATRASSGAGASTSSRLTSTEEQGCSSATCEGTQRASEGRVDVS